MKPRAWLAAFALITSGTAAAAGFNFALLGDTPYSPDEEIRFVEMLREINADDIAFVVHVGDFKSGWTSCDDSVFAQRKEMFAKSRHAFIFLPGDNEWTDCWRFPAGGYDPLERLSRLREIFFRAPMSLGMRPLKLTRQSDVAAAHPYPEHVRWKHGNVLFAGFNLPGGDNNLARMPQEHAQRDAAARDWLMEAFALARREKAGAVVVLMQANPFSSASRLPRRGFSRFMDLLARETTDFEGEVLLVHGDTHRYRVDRPLRRPGTEEPLQNFTRAEVFGSPRVEWVRARAVEEGARVKFEVSPGRYP